ncbi:hypothetical protein CYMTET_10281 [Cymbomonas tetramitiformis]|uniref:Uncharacterized protein n=1 Tax=Cymbomonas tetramitiformis TaxID=36881 RepID=A0AAE0GPM6_9CHLO|nr:hypothetical protein CYMTET_10281 [Cymbomonas tetramitiformis]
METRKKSARRKLLKESDLDSSTRLLDAVRDSPTCRTPPVPVPGAPTAEDDADTKADREKYETAKEIVSNIYAKAIRVNELVHDTLTYIVEPDTVAYGYLMGTDSAADRDGRRALVDLIKGTQAVGTPGTAVAVEVLGDDKTDRDDIREKLLSRLDKIEAFIETQRMGESVDISAY